MSAVPGAAIPTTVTPTGEAVVWAFDPWRERPATAVLATLGAAALCAIVVAARLPFVMGVAVAVFCVASVSPALTPVECRVDADGAARRGPVGWQRRRWADVRRVEDVPAGVLLSAHAARHWLDATRGLVLPMPASRRAELRAAVGTLRSAHGR